MLQGKNNQMRRQLCLEMDCFKRFRVFPWGYQDLSIIYCLLPFCLSSFYIEILIRFYFLAKLLESEPFLISVYLIGFLPSTSCKYILFYSILIPIISHPNCGLDKELIANIRTPNWLHWWTTSFRFSQWGQSLFEVAV